MSRFKQIIVGTEKEAYEKFPWLEKADFESAVIDIRNSYLIWIDGTWKDGTWIDGFWEYGVWKDGVWKDGWWKDGWWKGGTWEEGVWKIGLWEEGVWKNGNWLGGIWCRGIWEKGKIWSSIKQDYVRVKCWDKEKGKFILEEENEKLLVHI